MSVRFWILRVGLFVPLMGKIIKICVNSNRHHANFSEDRVRECDFHFSFFSNIEFFFTWFNVSGRSFQSSQLAFEVSHTGPCKSPCPGMESLGQFQAFGVRATNFGTTFSTKNYIQCFCSFTQLLVGGKQTVLLPSELKLGFCSRFTIHFSPFNFNRLQ